MARYTIRQLELGYDNAFPLGIAFDMWDHAGEQAYSPFSVTLLEGEGHKILFDCGFDPESAFAKAKIAQENDQNCHDTQAVLRANGVDPADIDTVIIGHCHWDHLNGLKYFPNAKIYVQEEEARRWSAAMKNPSFPITHKMVVDTECLELLEDWVAQGKVTTLTGDVDGLFALATAAGCPAVMEPCDRNLGGGYPIRIAFCTGPLGEELEFFQEKG